MVPDSTMSTFQTHTGTAFRAAQRDGFHISIKRGRRRRGEKGPSSGESGPSGTMNRFEWSICFSLLPPLFITIEDTGVVEREGSPLNTFFFLDLSSLIWGLKHGSSARACNNKAVVDV